MRPLPPSKTTQNLSENEKHLHLLVGVRKTVNPPYGFVIGRIFVYFFDATAPKAPSDEGAVSEAD